MKKIVFLMTLLSLNAFASTPVNTDSYSDNNCSSITDPTEKRECMDAVKRNEAEENFENMEENNQSSYKDDF